MGSLPLSLLADPFVHTMIDWSEIESLTLPALSLEDASLGEGTMHLINLKI
jgi:hypothetical protein